MRFGLGELDELPSLKEFEALAREALGSDEGIAADEVTEEPTDETAIETTGEVVGRSMEEDVAPTQEAAAPDVIATSKSSEAVSPESDAAPPQSPETSSGSGAEPELEPQAKAKHSASE